LPELPEVEVVRQGLERHVVGRTIAGVQVFHPRAVRRHAAGTTDFESSLGGMTVAAARRRGKYLWLPVAPAAGQPDGREAGAQDTGRRPAAEDALLAHLGMSGQLVLGDPARPLSPHARVRFTFTDGGPDLRFTDQRTFGHLLFAPGGADLPGVISHIAPDPLEPAFDEAAVAARLRTRRTGIKVALLDQSLVSGVGNIYADEALWRAKIHWARTAASLRRADTARLFGAVREVLTEALAAGGTSFDSLYINVNGESGYFGRSLAVYGRLGEPCPRCGTPVRRDPFANRSAYTCPVCQPRPRSRARDLRRRST
jgi:formamidopyrimidine-DNA glycosylase